jgi:hypothetical protein
MSRRRAPGRARSRNDRPIAFDVKPSEGLAFHAFHPDGFRWFAKLDETIDEEDIRNRFFRWLATAPEVEMERFVAAMATFRRTLIDEGDALAATRKLDEPPILRADDARDRHEWRRTLRVAGDAVKLNEAAIQITANGTELAATKGELAATKGELDAIAEADAEYRAAQAANGALARGPAKWRAKIVKAEVLRIAQEIIAKRQFRIPKRSEVAREVAPKVGRSESRTYQLLTDLETHGKISFTARQPRS